MESESIEVMMEDGEDGEIKEPFPAAVSVIDIILISTV